MLQIVRIRFKSAVGSCINATFSTTRMCVSDGWPGGENGGGGALNYTFLTISLRYMHSAPVHTPTRAHVGSRFSLKSRGEDFVPGLK